MFVILSAAAPDGAAQSKNPYPLPRPEHFAARTAVYTS